MKLKLLLSIILCVLLFSCTKKNKNAGSVILNNENLLSQTFTININKDTTLITKDGCVIKIPKGSLESNSQFVKLEVKEALTSTEMVLAGLTTMAGKEALSSGGMIYFNAAAGYEVSIKKEIEILVPTKNYNPDMQVYNGADSANKINWTDPAPLPKDSTINNIANGERLFKAFCANCHKPDADFTGPSLRGVSRRVTKEWIYHYIYSPVSANDPYAVSLKMKWKPTIMTAFPTLGKQEIDAILAYVETYDRLPNDPGFSNELPGMNQMDSACLDSCRKYFSKIDYLEKERADLLIDNGAYFNLERNIPITPRDSGQVINIPSTEPESKTVTPAYVTGVYYTINIKTTGWYNIDILLKEYSECIPSELFVNLKSEFKATYSVSLIIPSVKAFIEGGKLDNDLQYGFDETNGAIPLPQNRQCYIVATAEANGKLLFGKAAFTSKQKQTIEVVVKEMVKEDILKQIKDLNLDNVDAEIRDAPNADKLRVIEKKTTDAENLKPKNCDCWPVSDSSKAINTRPIAKI